MVNGPDSTAQPPIPPDMASGAEFPAMARRLFGNVRLDFGPAGAGDCSLLSAPLGGCRLSRLRAGRHVVHGERVIGGDAPDMIKLIIQTRGCSELHQAGRHLPVGPDTVVIYDPARPYRLDNPEAVDLLMLQIPRHAVPGGGIARMRRPLAAALAPGGLHRVLYALMDSTMREIGILTEEDRLRIGQFMLDLVQGLLDDGSGEETASGSLETLRARIKDYIAANLGRTELGAPEIARRMGCSLRYVYKAFEDERQTPAEYIWSERLRKAAELLHSRPLSPGFVGEVAFGLGFSSTAHFSRAFRSRYHQTPRDWCRAARA